MLLQHTVFVVFIPSICRGLSLASYWFCLDWSRACAAAPRDPVTTLPGGRHICDEDQLRSRSLLEWRECCTTTTLMVAGNVLWQHKMKPLSPLPVGPHSSNDSISPEEVVGPVAIAMSTSNLQLLISCCFSSLMFPSSHRRASSRPHLSSRRRIHVLPLDQEHRSTPCHSR